MHRLYCAPNYPAEEEGSLYIVFDLEKLFVGMFTENKSPRKPQSSAHIKDVPLYADTPQDRATEPNAAIDTAVRVVQVQVKAIASL